jgi:hypothetical protein
MRAAPDGAGLEDAPEQIDGEQNENDDDQDRDDAHGWSSSRLMKIASSSPE